MSAKKPIDPKPTEYRNILFRSRLEARTAVLLDNIKNVLSWSYEPETFKCKENGWKYTPDFKVVYFETGSRQDLYLEVKPSLPNEKYGESLLLFSKQMKHPLCLFIPDYYNQVYAITTFMKGVQKDVTFPLAFAGMPSAMVRASQFRFDL